MKLRLLQVAILAALVSFSCYAETDPQARVWTEAIKNGTAGKHQGISGELRTPRINDEQGNGTLRGPDNLEGTEATLVTLAQDWLTVQRTTLTLNAKSISVTYGGFGTNSSGGVKIFDFPAGRILVLGVTVENLKVTPTYTNDGFMGNDDGDFALGTVTAAGSAITSTEVDLAPSTSLSTMTNATDTALAASAQFDGTSTAVDAYLNLLVDSNEISASSTGTLSGTVKFTWANLGDY